MHEKGIIMKLELRTATLLYFHRETPHKKFSHFARSFTSLYCTIHVFNMLKPVYNPLMSTEHSAFCWLMVLDCSAVLEITLHISTAK